MKSLKLICVVIIYFFLARNCFSQPQTEWARRFNSSGNYDDYVVDMAIDKSGNVYLTGYVNINDTNQNYVTIKYNTQGVEQWVRFYDGPDHREDKPVAIAVDDSGNVVVTGYSYSNLEFDDIVTIKYNPKGDSLWVKKFKGIGAEGERPNAMALDKRGSIYITGYGIPCHFCPPDILTIKYGNNDTSWVKYFNGPTNQYDEGYDIISDKSNNVLASGRCVGTGGIILKYNPFGDFIDSTITLNYFGEKILLDSAQNIFLGFSISNSQNRADIGTAKFDSLKNLNWIRTYHNASTNNNDYFLDMCLDQFGNIAVTGVSGDSNKLAWDIATIRYNSNGDTLWIRRYNPAHNSVDEPRSITSDKFGNTYVTGFSDSARLFTKMITIKYSETGHRDWIAYYSNPFTTNKGTKVITDTLGNMYVTGIGDGTGTGFDIITIKYSTVTEISSMQNSIPGNFNLHQNYPNPFNSSTLIKYDIPVSGEISIVIYSVSGQKVTSLNNKRNEPGSYEVRWEAKNLASGIYYYTLNVNGVNKLTKKLILLK